MSRASTDKTDNAAESSVGGVRAAALPDAESSSSVRWPHSPANDGRPLDGIKVLDLSRIVAGPLCAMVLADLGADVIKVESPAGDVIRQWGPPFRDGIATYYAVANRNKFSVVVDLKTAAGQALLVELTRQADVVVSNFTDEVAALLGVDHAALAAENPSVVYVSISGFGPGDANRPGFDLLAQAASGLMSVTGASDGPPSKVGVAISDITAALYATIGVLAELVRRHPVGGGAPRSVELEVSLQDATLSLLTNQAAGWLLADYAPLRTGNDHPSVAPYGVFETGDGALALAVGTDAQFGNLCVALGLIELSTDERFADNHSRVHNLPELRVLLEGALSRGDAAFWQKTLDRHGVPSGPIRTVPEALAAAPAGLVQGFDSRHDQARTVTTPIQTDGNYPSPYLAPPALGEHTASILGSAPAVGAQR